MSITLTQNLTQVVLTKVEEPTQALGGTATTTVRLYPTGASTITLTAARTASVTLQPVLDPPPAQIVLSGAATPSTSVILSTAGPKGDTGPQGPAGGGGGGGAIEIYDNGVLVESIAEALDFYGPGVSISQSTDGRVELTFTGAGDATNIYSRVQTDISGVWGATFYVQDATQGGDWIITRIDGEGNATQSTSDDSANTGLSTAVAWASRFSLSYA